MALRTNPICLRFALSNGQGQGWSLYSGASWPVPSDGCGAFTVEDEFGSTRSLVLDAFDRKVWELATFNRISEVEPKWADKVDGASLTEISWEKHVRSESFDPAFSELDVSHLYVEPGNSDRRGASGYLDNGMRIAQVISIDAYVDGERITPRAFSEDIAENGDISFAGVKIEGRDIHFVIRGTASELKLTGRDHRFIVKPKASLDKIPTESAHIMTLLSNLAEYVARDRRGVRSRVSKAYLAGTYTAITGPDGNVGSAFVTAGGNYLSNAAISGAYTLMYWTRATDSVYAGGLVFNEVGSTRDGAWLLLSRSDIGISEELELGVGFGFFDMRLYRVLLTNSVIDTYFRMIRDGNCDAILPGF